MSTLTAKGLNGQLSFDGATVTITREGFVARSTHGRSEKALPLGHVGAVQYRPATALVNGFIQFSVTGEVSKRSVGAGKKNDASKDENAVLFRKSQGDEFKAVLDAIRAAQAGGTIAPTEDVAEQIQKLASLRDRGILSDDEFDAKKSELLARM